VRKLSGFSLILACFLIVNPLFTITLYAQSVNYEMVRVPGGSFQMGSASGGENFERPVHTVTLSAFSIGKYEVTQALYESVMGYNPSRFKNYADSPNRPVENVTWYDAIEFCNKLSERERLQPVYTISGREPATGYPITYATVTPDWSKNGYRLPAQWEYAARGGNGTPGDYVYSGSNDVNTVAWYEGNSNNAPQVVGTKTPNGLGLYDMSGNVWEWCWDRYGDYSSEAQTDPKGASSGSYRVRRGGGWNSSSTGARSAYRSYSNPNNGWNDNLGFRLVRP